MYLMDRVPRPAAVIGSQSWQHPDFTLQRQAASQTFDGAMVRSPARFHSFSQPQDLEHNSLHNNGRLTAHGPPPRRQLQSQGMAQQRRFVAPQRYDAAPQQIPIYEQPVQLSQPQPTHNRFNMGRKPQGLHEKVRNDTEAGNLPDSQAALPLSLTPGTSSVTLATSSARGWPAGTASLGATAGELPSATAARILDRLGKMAPDAVQDEAVKKLDALTSTCTELMAAVSTLTGKDEVHAQELAGLKKMCEGVISAVETMAADVRALGALITAHAVPPVGLEQGTQINPIPGRPNPPKSPARDIGMHLGAIAVTQTGNAIQELMAKPLQEIGIQETQGSHALHGHALVHPTLAAGSNQGGMSTSAARSPRTHAPGQELASSMPQKKVPQPATKSATAQQHKHTAAPLRAKRMAGDAKEKAKVQAGRPSRDTLSSNRPRQPALEQKTAPAARRGVQPSSQAGLSAQDSQATAITGDKPADLPAQRATHRIAARQRSLPSGSSNEAPLLPANGWRRKATHALATFNSARPKAALLVEPSSESADKIAGRGTTRGAVYGGKHERSPRDGRAAATDAELRACMQVAGHVGSARRHLPLRKRNCKEEIAQQQRSVVSAAPARPEVDMSADLKQTGQGPRKLQLELSGTSMPVPNGTAGKDSAAMGHQRIFGRHQQKMVGKQIQYTANKRLVILFGSTKEVQSQRIAGEEPPGEEGKGFGLFSLLGPGTLPAACEACDESRLEMQSINEADIQRNIQRRLMRHRAKRMKLTVR